VVALLAAGGNGKNCCERWGGLIAALAGGRTASVMLLQTFACHESLSLWCPNRSTAPNHIDIAKKKIGGGWLRWCSHPVVG
jgi:hypothetical protein